MDNYCSILVDLVPLHRDAWIIIAVYFVWISYIDREALVKVCSMWISYIYLHVVWILSLIQVLIAVYSCSTLTERCCIDSSILCVDLIH